MTLAIIQQFNGKDNFLLWQWKMKNILIQRDLDDTILGIEKKPTDITDEEWKKDKNVKSFIELHLADNVLLRVREHMNAKETWEKLEKIYKGKRLLKKFELCSLRMEEDGDLQDHLRHFQNRVNDLAMMGQQKYEDEDMALLLLISLPPSFKHLKADIMLGKSTKFDEVMDALQSRTKRSERTSKAHKVFVTRVKRGSHIL